MPLLRSWTNPWGGRGDKDAAPTALLFGTGPIPGGALLNAAQPEVRDYRLRYWDKGVANGPWSEVVKVTVAP